MADSPDRDTAVTLNQAGDGRAASGDPAGALEAYTRALDIAERLAAADPDNTGYQADLAITLNRVGDVSVALADPMRASLAYTRALGIVEQLAGAEADTTDYQRMLAVCLTNVGDVRMLRGLPRERWTGFYAPDPAGALEAYTRALGIFEQLAGAEPDSTDYQRELAVCLVNVASSLESSGDDAAHDFWTRALETLMALDASGKLPERDREVLDWLTQKLT